jgi:protein kinase A
MYQGGELQTIIHTESRDGVPEWAAKFYAANILEGLSYMHERNIVYRDLKPANVLLDNEGYTVIVDFGFAKIIKDNKTFTFCGTPLYLSPEIITQKGHNAGADHWSWGVMLYEMIVGMTPFYDGTQDQMGLFKNIVKCNMAWPNDVDNFMSKSAQDLITRMLTVNPADRLGGFAGGDKDIKSHPFFESINWQDLLSKKVEVPFKPKVSDPLDGSNFDDYSKLEAKVKKEILVPLTGAEQKLFDDF